MKAHLVAARIVCGWLVCLACLSPAYSEQTSSFDRGVVIEKIVCRADANQSYALLLPSAYARDRQWPIIYCFDPGARGRVPLERFKAAAEKFGFIIAGSNNSRNGANDVSISVNAMMTDTIQRLSIDGNRVYTAGFSGGGRVATGVALGLGQGIAGVVACGGGFPPSVTPSKSVSFALFATAGSEDFNYPEMHQLTREFTRLGLANRFATFEGGHDWLPAELADEAIGWLELQGMKTGRRPRDEKLIADLFAQSTSRAQAAETGGKLYEAYVRYSSLAADFKGLRDTAEYEKHIAELKDRKEVKQAARQEEEQERQQQERSRELFTLKAAANSNDERPVALANLQKSIADLRAKSEAKEPSSQRTVARRVINGFMVSLSEEARYLTTHKEYGAAALNLSLAVLIAPDNPRLQYNLACAYARSGDRNHAVEALRRAVEKGFKDTSLIESDKDLESLRGDSGYKQIVERLKKGS